MTSLEGLKQALIEARDSKDQSSLRSVAVRSARELPKTPESLELFKLVYELVGLIENPSEKGLATLAFAGEIPFTSVYSKLYMKVMEEAVYAADAIDEHRSRTTELMRLAEGLPKTDEFTELRVRAWRLAMGLPDKPRFAEPNLAKVAFELPKSSDISFFAGYTLLGVAKAAPKEGPFLQAYREAVELAIKAAETLNEPYYKRYALLTMSLEMPRTDGLSDLLQKTFRLTYQATLDMTDEFAKEFSLLELLEVVPKTREFYPLIQDLLERALSFFTVRKWMEDVEVFDIVDYILSAEEQGLSDAKKNRIHRERYSKMLASELEKLGSGLNDMRFIETLRPYAHVWVQPKSLRDAVKKVVDRLESLKGTYHGAEVERPAFVSERHAESAGAVVHRKDSRPIECISIDLGATNTVVMRKKKDESADFIHLGAITRQYDTILIVPTLLSPDTNNIGAEAGSNPVANLKQSLLEGRPGAREQMERFIKILYQHLRKATQSSGWFPLVAKGAADAIYITVPVGYQDYSAAIKDMATKAMKGARVELIEEPLAAAVGYQVVDESDRIVMVIDFGGSTLNTMLLRLNVNEVHIVAKPERAQMLGGHDIDLWLAERFGERVGMTGAPPWSFILAAEEMKIRLSERRDAPLVWDGAEVARCTVEEFEEMLEAREFYKTVDRTILNVLKRAEKVGLKKERIEAVLLTGGSSQIPSFKEKIGDLFPELRARNMIYDHSPLTAVGMGAAFYGTRDVTDRHLAVAYAMRYAPPEGKDVTHSYAIVLEKGEQLPLEKTFKVKPARKLGVQKDVTIELFEVPESALTRRWAVEDGAEYLKQELKEAPDLTLAGLKPVTLPFGEEMASETLVTFMVDAAGYLKIKYGPEGAAVETGLRLQ